MIPLIMGALGKVPWKLVGWAGLVVAVALLGWRISAWRAAYDALPGVQDALQREEACADGSTCRDREIAAQAKAQAATDEAVRGYQRELEDLRNRPVSVRTVRLCPPAATGNVRDAAPAGGTGQGSAPAGVVHAGTGPDIGGRLYALAGQADELAAQCRWIIARDRALAAPAP